MTDNKSDTNGPTSTSGNGAENAEDRPIGVVFWALANDDVAKMLEDGTTKLRPQDWKSGEKLWVVEAISPFGGAEEMLKDLKVNVFPDTPVHYVTTGPEGKAVKVV